MPSFIMIGWEMAEILHFEILRKHGQTNTQTHKQTHKHTNTQTDMGITIPRPPPVGGEVKMYETLHILPFGGPETNQQETAGYADTPWKLYLKRKEQNYRKNFEQ